MRILNAFSVNMLARPHNRVEFEEITLEKAAELARLGGVQSAVGHADTAALFSRLLGVEVPMVRATVALFTDDTALLGQYSGPRLPEGATELPAGAVVKWYTVAVMSPAKKRVVILRGVPGSGKSTYLDNHIAEVDVVCSADNYFIGANGDYAFDPAKLPAAHGYCLRKFTEAVLGEVAVVVVDNTNITAAEVAPYAALALANGYELEIRTISCDPAVAAARNTHGVPAHAVQRMATALTAEGEGFPPWWPHRVIVAE